MTVSHRFSSRLHTRSLAALNETTIYARSKISVVATYSGVARGDSAADGYLRWWMPYRYPFLVGLVGLLLQFIPTISTYLANPASDISPSGWCLGTPACRGDCLVVL